MTRLAMGGPPAHHHGHHGQARGRVWPVGTATLAVRSGACVATARSLSWGAATGVSAGEESTEVAAAMALLRKAVTLGFRTTNALSEADALDPLRDRDDFKLLMLDLAFPADPFRALHD